MALSLVEILIAMFIFMFGILGVLAVFPVAMDSAGRSVGRVRANVIAQSLLAQLQVDCRVSLIPAATATGVTADTLTSAAITNDWTGCFVTITEDGSVWEGQSRLIVATDISASPGILTVCPDWNPDPTGETPEFIITRMGLPSVPKGTVQTYDGATLTLTSADLTWADGEWDDFYVLMLSGLAKGEFRAIDTAAAPDTLELASDFFAGASVEPAAGNLFAIVRIAPAALPRGNVMSSASSTLDTNLSCTGHQWDGFWIRMLDGGFEGRSARIDDTVAAAVGSQFALLPSFGGDPSKDDAFEIVNYRVRMGYIREFTGQESFRAGFADHSDETVGPLSWSRQWTVPAVSAPAAACPSDGTASTIEVEGTDWSNAKRGMLVFVNEDPEDADAGGQVRLITGTSGTTTVSVFPDWTEIPRSTNQYRIQRSLGHFLVITTGRAAGRIFPITGYAPNPTAGDQITCAGVRFREIGVTAAKPNSTADADLRNATGFMIVGSDSFLGSAALGGLTLEDGRVESAGNSPTELTRQTSSSASRAGAFVEITSGDGKGELLPIVADDLATLTLGGSWTAVPNADDWYRVFKIPLNAFGRPCAAEAQVGPDYSLETPRYQEISEYRSVCIFTEGDALADGPVRVDVFVFRNFDNAASLWDNQRPVAHITGYVGRP